MSSFPSINYSLEDDSSEKYDIAKQQTGQAAELPDAPRVIQISSTGYFLYRLYDDGIVTIQHNGGAATTDEVEL